MGDVTQMKAWQALKRHYGSMKDAHLAALFAADPNRAQTFSLEFEDLLLDYSKNFITKETMELLFALAREAGLADAIEAMFRGERINKMEDRAVLHIALRNQSEWPIKTVDGKTGAVQDVVKDVNAVLKHMAEFAGQVRSGEWKGATGKAIRNIVNIGIGGSDLGPKMACEALKAYADPRLNVQFVSNVDGFHLVDTVRNMNPEETLFIIASKTFTT